MDDLEREITELFEKTARTRFQFLNAELQTCHTALDMAEFEQSIGEMTIVAREIASVEKGILIIQRFLAQVPDEHRQEFKSRLTELQTRLDDLKGRIHPA